MSISLTSSFNFLLNTITTVAVLYFVQIPSQILSQVYEYSYFSLDFLIFLLDKIDSEVMQERTCASLVVKRWICFNFIERSYIHSSTNKTIPLVVV